MRKKIILENGQDDCENFDLEFGKVESCLKKLGVVVVESERRDSGLSIFLSRVEKALEYEHKFSIDAKLHKDIPDFLAHRLLDKFRITKIGKLLRKMKFLTPILSLFSVSAPPISFGVGFTARGFIEAGINQPLSIETEAYLTKYDSNYCEYVVKWFERIIRKRPKHKILIIIDNAQDLTDQGIAFLYHLWKEYNPKDIRKIHLVFGHHSSNGNLQRIYNVFPENIAPLISQNHIDIVPSAEVIRLLYKSIKKIEKDIAECKEMLILYDYNMRNIKAAIQGTDARALVAKLTPIQQNVLFCISISKIMLNRDNLIAIFKSMEDIFINIQDDDLENISKTLDHLETLTYIVIESTGRLYLNEKNNDAICIANQLKNTPPTPIVVAQARIYDYFYDQSIQSLSDDELDYLALDPCNIHKEPQKINQIRATLIRRKLQNTKQLNILVLNSFVLTDDNSRILIACANYYQRNFTSARNALANVSETGQASWNYHMMNALLYIRERNYPAAYKTLDNLFPEIQKRGIETQAYYANLLAQCLLHNNEIDKFRKFCEEILPKVRLSNQYGYFLNVIAAYQKPNRTAELQELATQLLSKDSFGSCLSNANRLTHKIISGDLKENTLRQLQDILSRMNRYETDNLHIIHNTIGMFYLLRKNDKTNDLAKAKENFDLALYYHHGGSMPKVFITINLAFVAVLQKHYQQAQMLLDEVEDIVSNKQEVGRIRQKYYINRALIEKICRVFGNYKGKQDVSYYIKLAEKYPDKRDPDITDIAVKAIESLTENSTFEDIKRAMVPCYLEYWYFNPSKLIEIDTL